MFWVITIAVSLLLVIFSQYRILTGFGLSVAIIASFLLWHFEIRERGRLTDRITNEEVHLDRLELERRHRRSFKLEGRLTNSSEKFTLSRLHFLIQIQECPDEQKNCLPIAEQKETLSLTVPPKQARNFDKNIFFDSHIKDRDEYDWNIEIISVEATQ